MAKIRKIILQFDWLIKTIDSVRTDGSMAIGQRRLLWSIVDTIDKKKKKILTDGSITPMKMRPKVSNDSIDRYHRYRSIDPSPIVPIYVAHHAIVL